MVTAHLGQATASTMILPETKIVAGSDELTAVEMVQLALVVGVVAVLIASIVADTRKEKRWRRLQRM